MEANFIPLQRTAPLTQIQLTTYPRLCSYIFGLIMLVILLVLTGCQTLPTQPHLAKSQYLSQQSRQAGINLTHNTDLITHISRTKNPDPTNLSGYYPLLASNDAFASRSILTSLSQHTIDIQYYIWHNDTAGQLMLKDLYQAAERGVKVRLLLDDLATNPALDQQLLAFAQHPNVAVRLINPKVVRNLTPANFVLALPRYQRRMHNKSMTFDHQLSIIGGRNIGDEYLRSDKENEFSDLDVLLAGKVIKPIQDSFEQYWQSPLSYDIERLVTAAHNPAKNQTDEPFLQTLDKISTSALDGRISKSSQLYQAASGAVIDQKLLNKRVNFRWVPITFVVDDVTKLQQQDARDSRLVHQVRRIVGTPKRQFTIISSYFVPTALGVAELTKLAQDSVQINVLTNSLDATDVPIVHSGYSETRTALLQSGINLYELKSTADPDLRHKKHRLSRSKVSTSLHTKAFAVDDRVAFIGSYNVDPRSANINTELGVLIFDKQLVQGMHQSFDDAMLNVSYQVRLDPQGKLQWHTQTPEGTPTQLNKEPKLSWINGLWVKIFSALPITSLL